MPDNQMKPSRYILLAVLVLLLAQRTGGGASPENGRGIPLPSATVSLPRVTPSLTETPVVPTKTPTPQPTFTPTVTLLPTFTFEQKDTHAGDLLTGTNFCSFPCYWGIVPGKTSFEELKHFFMAIGLSNYISEDKKTIYYTSHFTVKNALNLDIISSIKNNTVDAIQTRVYGLKEPGITSSDWSAFGVKNIFQTYGLPSRINFSIIRPVEPPLNTGKVLYGMTFVYESNQMIISYGDGKAYDGGLIRVCPTKENEFNDVEMNLGPIPAGSDVWWGETLEKGTSMTKEQFYKLLMESTGPACIDLVRSKFPF